MSVTNSVPSQADVIITVIASTRAHQDGILFTKDGHYAGRSTSRHTNKTASERKFPPKTFDLAKGQEYPVTQDSLRAEGASYYATRDNLLVCVSAKEAPEGDEGFNYWRECTLKPSKPIQELGYYIFQAKYPNYTGSQKPDYEDEDEEKQLKEALKMGSLDVVEIVIQMVVPI